MCFGVSEKSSVCIHVNIKWQHSMPRLASRFISHNDVCTVYINPGGSEDLLELLINIYNHPKTHAGLEYLYSRLTSCLVSCLLQETSIFTLPFRVVMTSLFTKL